MTLGLFPLPISWPRQFEFQMSADVISENVGIIAGTALPALYVQSHFHCAAWANRRTYMSKGIG